MPIHLPPLNRRDFLTRTLTAGAALALAPRLLAENLGALENFALLSDIHLAGDRTAVARGVNMAEHFRRAADEIISYPDGHAGLFVTGDCAYNSGEIADYHTVAELLKPLRQHKLPVHLVLGNHDNRERFWEALREQRPKRAALPDRQVSLLKTRHANWFILDSLEKTLSTPGLLGREQLDWLARTLDANPDRPALVLIHHNPGLDGGQTGIKDTAALFEVIRPRKQVKAYIYGHTHKWIVKQDPSGIQLINLPPVAYVFHKDDPAGWVQASLEPNRLKLELRCIDKTHPKQGEKFDLEFRT